MKHIYQDIIFSPTSSNLALAVRYLRLWGLALYIKNLTKDPRSIEDIQDILIDEIETGGIIDGSYNKLQRSKDRGSRSFSTG